MLACRQTVATREVKLRTVGQTLVAPVYLWRIGKKGQGERGIFEEVFNSHYYTFYVADKILWEY